MKKWIVGLAAAGLLTGGAIACEKPVEEDNSEQMEEQESEASATQASATQTSDDEAMNEGEEAQGSDEAGDMTAQQAMDSLPNVTPQDLQTKREGGETIYVYDVNGEGTRLEMGLVPDAVLLASSEDYDMSALPEDKSASLVFYCGGPSCMAAPRAAATAANNGYEGVAIMREGIRGWKDAEFTVAEYKPEEME